MTVLFLAVTCPRCDDWLHESEAEWHEGRPWHAGCLTQHHRELAKDADLWEVHRG